MVTTSTIRQLLSVAPIFLLSFLYGCKVGYTQVATSIFMSPDSPFPVSKDEISWIGSISFSGTFFSLIISYLIGDKFGRRTFLISTTLVYLIFWLLVLITSSGIVIVVGLFFYGIASSMHYIFGTIYIGEITTPQNREICGIIFILANGIGTQVEFFSHYFKNYRILAAFPSVVSIFVFILCFFCMVESPYYLLAKKRITRAKKNLGWLNDTMTDEEISAELRSMENYICENRSKRAGNLKVIVQWENFNLLLIMMFITIAACLNLGPIMVYGALVVHSFKHLVDTDIFLGIFNISTSVAAISSLISIKLFNRRSLAIFGFIIMAILELFCAVCYYYEYTHNNSVRFVVVVIEILLISISAVYSIMCSSSIQVLKTEIFPHRCKEFYIGVLIFVSDVVYFAVSKLFFAFYLLDCMDKFFAVYIVMNVGAALVIHLFISETKNKELYQIRNTLNNCNET